jgi:hypothetical protein
MKRLFSCLPALALLAFVFTPSLLRAQDAPPDMGDQGAPPPDQGGPAPDQGPPPDQAGGQPPDNGQDAGADPGVSYQTFYDNLSNQGTWIQTDNYGYVFQPNVSDPNWAPYSDGHWVFTDQGWTWVSDEPWGWATYHYGRWANIDGYGWIWVPGYRWAPAWVSWRYGGGYCGWAPLPPETIVGAEFGGYGGYHYGGDVDVSFHIGAGFYNFVPVGHMGDPNVRPYIANRYNNYGIINHTTNITNININRNSGRNGFGGVAVNGPPLSEINAHASRPVQTMRLTASNAPGQASVQGNSLSVYAPRVNPATVHQGRPASVSRTIASPTFNRGDSITRPLAVSSTVRPAAPSAEAIQSAHQAQAHVPASAKIATSRTPVKSANLTRLTPATQTHTNAAVNSPSTYRPAVESNAQTYRPASTPATTYRPETQSAPEVKHSESQPSSVYHAPAQSSQTVHSEAQPSSSYHPQSQSTYRPEAQHSSGGGGAPTHIENHEASVHSSGGGAGPSHPSGGGGGGASHPSGGGGASHPSGGGGAKPAGKPAAKPADKKP